MHHTEALGDRICEPAAHLNAANCRLFELIAQFDNAEGWGIDGCNSCAHWLNWKCGIGQNAAREKVRVAHALAKLPLIHASLSKGEISYSKVRAMSRVATPENEDYLLMIARHGTAAHVETVVRGYRRAKVDLELEEANTRHQRRELSWYFDDDDMVVVKIRLTPEDGAHFIKAIERATKKLQAERGSDAEQFEETSLLSDRADALMHVVANPTDTEVQVHVSAETLVEFDSDGCCHLHGHHIEHWADGGSTSLNNLVQLCSHHHRLVHEGGFDVRAMHDDASDALAVRFDRPDGSQIDDAVPQHCIATCAEASLKQRNAQLGLAIDHDTAFPNWDGEPVDHAMAIDGMFTASGDFAMTHGGVFAETLAK